jgi:hypothetical protein
MKTYIIPLIILSFMSVTTPATAYTLQGETSIQELFPDAQQSGIDINQTETTAEIPLQAERGWQSMPIPAYQLQTRQSPGILGFWVSPMQPHYVTQVEPASDAFGYIFVGDIILSMDNIDAHRYWQAGQNIGAPGTTTVVTYRHNGLISTITVRRKPIEDFPEQMRSQLNWPALNR